MRRMRFALAMMVACLPNFLKIRLYRHCWGYRIGSGVRLGLSVFADLGECDIADGVRIGHLNLFVGTARLGIGREARIGHLNVFRGGTSITLGAFASVLRGNVFNSIPDAEVVSAPDATFELGDGAVVTSNHWLDFTDKISIGAHAIVGGRGSSLWTHNRQRTRPIEIGPHVYIGSEVRMAPGAAVGAFSIVALGAVVMQHFTDQRVLIMGNPATIVRPLTERDLFLVVRKTRADLPEALHHDHLTPDLIVVAQKAEAVLAEALRARKTGF